MNSGRSRRAGADWHPGPARPRLAPGAIHIWRADLDAAGGDPPRLLSTAERERGERILGARERLRWMRSRAVLRSLLGGYLELDPRALELIAGAHGKPELHAPGPALSFNLSHSGAIALYAFAADGAVGVDVELARRPLDAVALAARALGEREARRLAAMEPNRRQEEFRRIWVRHEARMKCLGLGLGGQPPAVRAAGAVWVSDLELEAGADGAGADAAAAVAAPAAPRELRCWVCPGPRRGARPRGS